MQISKGRNFPSPLKSFSPYQPNLVSTIQSWLNEIA
ncbi:MAG: hypothetical protein RMY28_006555 [Nostoc sp. ChiSLP01]